MKTEKILFPDTASLKRAAAVIRDGGLVAFPTETVYGLGGSALDAKAAEKIYAAKGRPSDNPLIIHLADASDAEKYCETNGMFYRLAERFCPGPLTVILPKKDCIPYTVTGGLDTVAVRIPSHPIANALIRLSGVPIAAPSANLSGKPSPTCFAHIEHDLDGRVDMLIDGGECEIGLESTIVKPTDDGRGLHLLRPGGITVEMLRTVTDTVIPDKCLTEKLAEGTRPLAPGMMYRHYAPDAPLCLVEAEDAAFLSFVSVKLKSGENCGVLCYDEDLPFLGETNTLSLGPKSEKNTQAHRLFECLRAFPNVTMIYSRMPEKDGIGLAVFNRLIKAAGYTVIRL